MLEAQKLSEWFAAYAPGLVLYARQWLSCAAAEDTVADVFLRLMEQTSEPQNVKAWLYRSVRNSATSAIRSMSRRRKHEELAAQARVALFEPDFAGEIDAASAELILRTLAREQREIVTLRIWAQMSFKEIAAVVDLSASTVFDHYRQALAQIKQKLESPCSMNQS